jgi:hypothetical protein
LGSGGFRTIDALIGIYTLNPPGVCESRLPGQRFWLVMVYQQAIANDGHHKLPAGFFVS